MTLINNIDGLLNAPNASGAPWFQVVLPEDVASIPDVILDQIATAITLNASATAYNIMATVGTVQWSETPQEVNGRLQYKSVFSFIIPKDRADVLNYAQHLNNRGVIAIVRDANGQSRLMGTVDEPATFRLATRTLGNTGGQRNEHFYEIVLTSPKPVPFYQVTDHLPAPVPPSGSGTCPSLAIEVYADALMTTPTTTVDFGDTVYIKLTAANITPTSYSVFIGSATEQAPTITQASNTFSWDSNIAGAITIAATATDGTAAAADATPFSLTVANAPTRAPFTGNYSALAGSFSTGFQADGYGCFRTLYRWTTEPATSQDCEVEYYCGTLFGNSCYFGFTQVLTSLSIIGNGFTGVFNNGSSLGYFYANSVLVGTFYNPSTVDDVIKVTWNATDKKFRLYVAGVLTYTSTYTYSGSPYPAAGANSGLQPVAGCFVTRLD